MCPKDGVALPALPALPAPLPPPPPPLHLTRTARLPAPVRWLSSASTSGGSGGPRLTFDSGVLLSSLCSTFATLKPARHSIKWPTDGRRVREAVGATLSGARSVRPTFTSNGKLNSATRLGSFAFHCKIVVGRVFCLSGWLASTGMVAQCKQNHLSRPPRLVTNN